MYVKYIIVKKQQTKNLYLNFIVCCFVFYIHVMFFIFSDSRQKQKNRSSVRTFLLVCVYIWVENSTDQTSVTMKYTSTVHGQGQSRSYSCETNFPKETLNIVVDITI